MVLTWLRSIEPKVGVPAGHDIGFRSKRGYGEIMDHIFGSHCELHVPPNRNMKFVDLTLSGLVLGFPHPLFTNNIDLHCIRGWRELVVEDHCSPEKYGH